MDAEALNGELSGAYPKADRDDAGGSMLTYKGLPLCDKRALGGAVAGNWTDHGSSFLRAS